MRPLSWDGALSRYDSQPVFPGMEQETTTITITNTTSNIDNTDDTLVAAVSKSANLADRDEAVTDNSMIDPVQITLEDSNDPQAHSDNVLPVQTVWDAATGLHYHNYDQISGELDELESSLANLSVHKDTIKGQNHDSDEVNLNLEKEQLPTSENVKGDNKVPTLEEIMKGGNITTYVNSMFKKKAETNGSYIPIGKLSARLIKSHQPSQRSPSIDPYSSLEDIGDSDKTDEPLDHSGDKPKYYMRSRPQTRTRHSTKPLRENRTNVNYAELAKFPDLSDSPKKPKRRLSVLSSPSSSRIVSQTSKIGVPVNTVPVPLLPANKEISL